MSTTDLDNNREKNRGKDMNRPVNYVVSIVVNTAVLIVIHLIPNWNIVFITDNYHQILWAMDMALGVQIAGSIVLLFFHPLHLHHLFNAVFAVVNIVSTAVILAVFPFDFSMVTGTWLNTLVKAILIGAIVGLGISIIVNVIQALVKVRR